MPTVPPGLSSNLSGELCQVLLRKLPEPFRDLIADSLAGFVAARDEESNLLQGRKKRGRLHHGRWFLRMHVFYALTTIGVGLTATRSRR